MRSTGELQYIVAGQRVTEGKTVRAREFRHEMTSAERKLWTVLRRNQLLELHFRRQQIIDGFIVDFFCDAARLVVEVDGSVHDGHGEQDAERDRILAARSLRVLRFRNSEFLRSLPAEIGEIVRAIEADPSPRRGGES